MCTKHMMPFTFKAKYSINAIGGANFVGANKFCMEKIFLIQYQFAQKTIHIFYCLNWFLSLNKDKEFEFISILLFYWKDFFFSSEYSSL